MAWTKAKTAIVVAIAVVCAGGGGFAVKRLLLGPNWTMTMENLNSLPPVLILRPTKFPKEGGNSLANGNNGKTIQKNVLLQQLVAHAYDVPQERIIFPPDFPSYKNTVDLMLTLNDHPREALQKAIQRQFHYDGHLESREKEILVLQVKHPNAPGLKISAMLSGSAGSFPGHFNVINSPLSSLTSYLSTYLGKTVVDETGLTNHYDLDFQWKTVEELKQVVTDELGLELVSSQQPVEMLIVERTRN